MAKTSSLTGLTSFLCMLVETLKLLVMYSSMLCMSLAVSFEKEETIFHHSIHPTNFVFENKLKLTIENNVPKPEQYSEFVN